jgi:DNA-binding NtrC family response regulator
LVAAEDPGTPLTDQQLVEMLAAENVKIARRTVTQYRRELQLPPAHRRQPHGSTAGASRLSPDEEQRVRRALEARTRRRQAEPPPQRDREETSEIPPEVQEAPHHRDPEALAWLNLQGIEWWRLAADPQVRAAHRDLQTALAHPKLRSAVLLALRAFALAAESGITIPSSGSGSTPAAAGAVDTHSSPPPADASEPVLHMQEVPAVRETRMRDIPMICQSRKMQELCRRIEGVLQTTATVLIMGEPGTGKGLVARILHDQGSRRQGPFISVSCTGIPETRLEGELFSHFERAAGGTLFIDGIAELSPTLQAKLLRVLQEGSVERIESPEPLPTQARIIAAATPELEQLIGAGTFRRDLFYRLNVYPITLPPLRERQEDLSPLTMHFLKRFSQALGKEVRGISKEAMGWLERYPWPGNVRELAEVIEQAVAQCQGPTVTTQDLPQVLREPSRVPGSSGEAVRRPAGAISGADLEKQLIQQALEQAHGNKAQAAKMLGLSRTQLRLRMRQYGLENG